MKRRLARFRCASIAVTHHPEGGPSMHFHLPKPLHGWREFAGEVGIIVVGVLIALGAEQVVESVHWRKSVSQMRQAMRSELGIDRKRLEINLAQDSCMNERLDAILRWA